MKNTAKLVALSSMVVLGMMLAISANSGSYKVAKQLWPDNGDIGLPADAEQLGTRAARASFHLVMMLPGLGLMLGAHWLAQKWADEKKADEHKSTEGVEQL